MSIAFSVSSVTGFLSGYFEKTKASVAEKTQIALNGPSLLCHNCLQLLFQVSSLREWQPKYASKPSYYLYLHLTCLSFYQEAKLFTLENIDSLARAFTIVIPTCSYYELR